MIEELLKTMAEKLKELADQNNEAPSEYELLVDSLENESD